MFKSNPSTLIQVKNKVKQCVDELNKDEAKVLRIVANLYKRAQSCKNENGGHFGHKMSELFHSTNINQIEKIAIIIVRVF